MAGGKETPRQKMIGMMYLFLTALLALNVSKEIINAFVVINHGIEETNHNFNAKLKNQYEIFKQELALKPARVQPWFDKAEGIRKESELLIKYLDDIKLKIVAESMYNDAKKYKDAKIIKKDSRTGQDTMLNMLYYDKKEDYDAPTRLLIGEPATPKKGPDSAVEIVQKCQKFRDLLNKACEKDPGTVKRFNEAFAFKEELNWENKKEPWGVINFDHSPVVASIAVISKLQTDIKNAESTAIEFLLTMISASTIKIDRIEPIIKVKSSLIAVGDSLVAEIGLGAIDGSKSPTIMLNGRPVPVRNGVGYFSGIQSTSGDQNWKGTITFDGPDGPQTKDFTIPFKVSSNSDAVIDASKMNVIYSGVENPIAISVPGTDSDKLEVTPSNPKVKLRKVGSGTYLAIVDGRFNPKEEVEISVSGITSTGGRKNFGKKKFRGKNLPDPVALIGGKGSSEKSIALATLQAQTRMVAVLPDFLFDGVNYTIVGFKMAVPTGSGLDDEFPSSGENLTPQMKDRLSKMRSRQNVSFTDILAKGPDGGTRKCPNLNFKLQ